MNFRGRNMQEAFTFYRDALQFICDNYGIDKDDAVLAVAAGEFDRNVLLAAGFQDVVISNMDVRMTADSFTPFKWSYQDAERLDYDDNSFGLVVVHSGLHHCRVPHQALAEMYRVAREGVLFIESRDSMLMRMATRFGLVADYEIEAVVGNDSMFGGQRNSATPNYVYRWTEREVEKIANSIDPTGPLSFHYFYALRLPLERLAMHRNPLVRTAGRIFAGPVKILAHLMRRQGNLFGAFIGKPRSKWPWIAADGQLDRNWAEQRFVAIPGSAQR
jgi:Methylase involved in ubiquinone/menaquinone biosynthesis